MVIDPWKLGQFGRLTWHGRVWHPRAVRSSLLGPAAVLLALGCGTVDPGDHFIRPEARVDEGFYHCRIQPEIITAHSCASGGPGEAGSCHADRSAMFLDPLAETDPPPPCEDDRPVGDVPASYDRNFQAVQLRVGTDPTSSPIYRRAVGLDAHPRQIFDETSPEAMLLADWIRRGGQ
jgi:hypothetical protein